MNGIGPGLLCLLVCVAVVECESPDRESTGEEAETSAVRSQVGEAVTRLTANAGGRRILEAIEAHGGLEDWYKAPTSSYTWEYANIPGDLQFKSYLVADNATRASITTCYR